MAGKIYWGPPGSYKTSSAVMDDVAACAAAGRTLITNIRGMNEARIREHAPKVHADFKVIHLRRDVADDMDRMRRWWHWAPEGAFIIFDEIQSVYPPDWSASKMHDLDMEQPRFINGEEIARDVSLIFDMHRHGNWDWTFTTPSIRKVRAEIRAAAEVAYKHKNLAIHGSLPGMKGRFMQFAHLAEDNGSVSSIFQHRSRKIAPWVFKCYDSTATGQVSDTKAGISLLAHPRILGTLALLVCVALTISVVGLPRMLAGKSSKSDEVPAAPVGAGTAGAARAQDHRRDLARPAPVEGSGGMRSARGLAASEHAAAPLYSSRWRYVGLIEVQGQARMLIDNGDSTRPIAAELCQRDAAGEVFCDVDGERITSWTGTTPRPRPLMEAVASLGAPMT